MTPEQYAKASPSVRAAYVAGLAGVDLVQLVRAYEDGRKAVGVGLAGAVWIGAEGFIFRTGAVQVPLGREVLSRDLTPIVPYEPLVTTEQLGMSVPDRPGYFRLEDLGDSSRVDVPVDEDPDAIVRWTVETKSPNAELDDVWQPSPNAELDDVWQPAAPLLDVIRLYADSGLDWRKVNCLEIGQWVIVPRNERDTEGLVVRRRS